MSDKVALLKDKMAECGWSEEGLDCVIQFVRDAPKDDFSRYLVHRYTGIRIRKPGRPKEIIPYELRKEVFERDAYRCKGCGDWHDLTIDHIYPEILGGATTLENLQALCRPCNLRKGTKTE